jgi:hypothetical protein
MYASTSERLTEGSSTPRHSATASDDIAKRQTPSQAAAEHHRHQHPHRAPPERMEALAASRAESFKQEVEELRVALARAQLRQQQLVDDHAAQVAALTAELEARGRGEMLARTRCEAAEIELRSTRQQLNKLREAAKKSTSSRQHELSADVLERCKGVMGSLARHGFSAAVLSWRRRALRSGVAKWQASAQLMAAAEVEAEIAQTVRTTEAFIHQELDATLPGSPEHRLRRAHNERQARRLGNYFESAIRAALLRSMGEWRLAACALAAEEDLHDVAGRLRAAQAGMVRVLDGRSAAEEHEKRHAALARALVGVASLKGVRREKRERVHSLHLGFRPWCLMLLADRLREGEKVKQELDSSRNQGESTTKRVETLAREVGVLRNNLAASQGRTKQAMVDAESAREEAARAEEARDKSDALERLARHRAEALEREKYNISTAAKKERHAASELRRGVVALTVRNFLRRRAELQLEHALSIWSALVCAAGPLAAASDGEGGLIDDDVRDEWRRAARGRGVADDVAMPNNTVYTSLDDASTAASLALFEADGAEGTDEFRWEPLAHLQSQSQGSQGPPPPPSARVDGKGGACGRAPLTASPAHLRGPQRSARFALQHSPRMMRGSQRDR